MPNQNSDYFDGPVKFIISQLTVHFFTRHSSLLWFAVTFFCCLKEEAEPDHFLRLSNPEALGVGGQSPSSGGSPASNHHSNAWAGLLGQTLLSLLSRAWWL